MIWDDANFWGTLGLYNMASFFSVSFFFNQCNRVTCWILQLHSFPPRFSCRLCSSFFTLSVFTVALLSLPASKFKGKDSKNGEKKSWLSLLLKVIELFVLFAWMIVCIAPGILIMTICPVSNPTQQIFTSAFSLAQAVNTNVFTAKYKSK